MINFNCQYCGMNLRMDDALAGRDGWCRACKRMVIVPASGMAIRVEDLPQGEAISRLQHLLQYAATKADKYKAHLAKEAQQDEQKAALNARAQEAQEALIRQRAEYESLRAHYEAALAQLEKAAVDQKALEAALKLTEDAHAVMLKAETAALASDLETERAARSALELRVGTQDGELSELREIAATQEQLTKDRIAALEADCASAQSRLQSAEQDLEEALNQCARLRDAAPKVNQELEQLQQDVATAQSRLQSVEEERDALATRLDQFYVPVERFTALESEIAAARSRAEEAEGELQEARDEYARLQESIASTDQENERLRGELASALSRLQEMAQALEDSTQEAKVLQGTTARVEELATELTSVQAQLSARDRELEDARAECTQARALAETAQQAYETIDADMSEVWVRLKDVERERDALARRLGTSALPGSDDALESAQGIEAAHEIEDGTPKAERGEPPLPEEELSSLNEDNHTASQTPASIRAVLADLENSAEHCAPGQYSAILSPEPGGARSPEIQAPDSFTQGKAVEDMEKEGFVARWHREAEVEGARNAQFRLGVRYLKGLGVTQDDTAAFRWLSRAATHDHAGALYELGRMFAEGRGVTKDIARALDCFRKASDQGEAGAQYELGLMCLKGIGVTEDSEAALAWFRKSAQNNSPNALYMLGVIYADESVATLDYTAALDCLTRASELGHIDAQYRLGSMYLDGNGVVRDEVKALDWLRKAAEKGHTQAQFALGTCLEEGRGAVQNYVRAYAWYSVAAVRLDQARAARDKLAAAMIPEQLLQGQQLAEAMHIESQTEEVIAQ